MESLLLLNLIPLVACLLSLCLPAGKIMRIVIAILAFIHVAVVSVVLYPVLIGNLPLFVLNADLSCDRIAAWFIVLTNVVWAMSLGHAICFFEFEDRTTRETPGHQRFFYASAVIFAVAMTFVFLADNLGILWISVEATTLSSAALVYFSRTKHALEATWKYLMICSVGIAFALLGSVLIFASSQTGGIEHGTLSFRKLGEIARNLDYPLLRLGFIFCLLGYGTKAGVFPLHSWLPDAHSEAPAPASSMLSGALLNCALFAIWRVSQVVVSADHRLLSSTLTLGFGAITAVAASFFLVRQHSLKRLWAYSSIENVGIMLVAIGLGSGPLFFLQALNHSLAKVSLFLLSGNIVQYCDSKSLADIRGLMSSVPSWGILLAVSALAVTGCPPFGSFVSEWLLLVKCIEQHQLIVTVCLVFALSLSFIAIMRHLGSILFGTPREGPKPTVRFASGLLPALLVLCAIACGVTCIPSYMVPLR